MRVFKIVPDVDNYYSLLAKDPVGSLLAFEGSVRAPAWKPLMAVEDNFGAPEPDVIDLGAGNLVLHGRSERILGPMLRQYAELLPVHWRGKTGVVVNILGLSRCLDAEQTVWVHGKESGKRIRIVKHVFKPKDIPNQRNRCANPLGEAP